MFSILQLLLQLLRIGFRVFVTVYYAVCFLVTVLASPFIRLYHMVKERLSYTEVGRKISDADDKFCYFKGFVPFCAFVICAVYSVVLLLLQIGVEDGYLNFAQVLIFNTPIGSFLGFFADGLDFSPEAIVSIAFTSVLFSACMGDEKPVGFCDGLIRIVRHVVFFVAFAHLSILLAGLFGIVGDWIYSTVTSLYNSGTDSFFYQLGRVALLIVLGYPAVAMVLLAVKEYAECIILGVLFLLFTLLLSLLMQYGIDWDPQLENDLLGGFVLFAFFAVDVFRPYVDDFVDRLLGKYSYIPPRIIENLLERYSQS